MDLLDKLQRCSSGLKQHCGVTSVAKRRLDTQPQRERESRWENMFLRFVKCSAQVLSVWSLNATFATCKLYCGGNLHIAMQ